MVNYSYYYVKTIGHDSENPKIFKFLKGNTKLQETPKDVWSTIGRYELRSRLLRGGLSGSGDVYHPANVTFKVRHQRFSLVSNPVCRIKSF
ncbi:calpain-A-like isoform X1 [Vespula squamosa]|uniref:Calpain-A-like isoform X1 n=1 Tax=Vespula squamosa TaxID=30214 RepID=A0ABD2C1X5_VESSQ